MPFGKKLSYTPDKIHFFVTASNNFILHDLFFLSFLVYLLQNQCRIATWLTMI